VVVYSSQPMLFVTKMVANTFQWFLTIARSCVRLRSSKDARRGVVIEGLGGWREDAITSATQTVKDGDRIKRRQNQ